MTSSSFKDIDTEGMETLIGLSSANEFNKWMFDTIRPYIQKRILEIGSGIGNISVFFLNDNATISLSDIRTNYIEFLQKKFSENPTLVNIYQIDLVDKNFDQKFSHLFNSFDSIFALNVIEHIKEDNIAIENCKKLLVKGGQLVVLVPAYRWLYNKFDEVLGHYRRYSMKTLNTLMAPHLTIVHSQYFNFAGIFGWLVSGSIFKRKTIPHSEIKIFNKLVPLLRIVDKLVLCRMGLSVILVGKKTS